MATRRKTFVAARDFSVHGEAFKAGDEIPNPSLVLKTVLTFGDSFAVVKKPNRRNAAESET